MLTTKHASIALLTAAAALTLVLLGGALAHADDLGFFGEAIFDRLDTNHDGVISSRRGPRRAWSVVRQHRY
jgi:hypothetical protein